MLFFFLNRRFWFKEGLKKNYCSKKKELIDDREKGEEKEELAVLVEEAEVGLEGKVEDDDQDEKKRIRMGFLIYRL